DSVISPLMAASATFALKAGVWFRRARLLIVSPDFAGQSCPPSGRNSTYPSVQILEASSSGDPEMGLKMKQGLSSLAETELSSAATPNLKLKMKLRFCYGIILLSLVLSEALL